MSRPLICRRCVKCRSYISRQWESTDCPVCGELVVTEVCRKIMGPYRGHPGTRPCDECKGIMHLVAGDDSDELRYVCGCGTHHLIRLPPKPDLAERFVTLQEMADVYKREAKAWKTERDAAYAEREQAQIDAEEWKACAKAWEESCNGWMARYHELLRRIQHLGRTAALDYDNGSDPDTAETATFTCAAWKQATRI